MHSSHQIESARADSASGPCGLVSDSRRASGCPGTDPGTQQGLARLPDEATEAAAAIVETALHARVPEGLMGARAGAVYVERGRQPADGSSAVFDANQAADTKAGGNFSWCCQAQGARSRAWSRQEVSALVHLMLMYVMCSSVSGLSPSDKLITL